MSVDTSIYGRIQPVRLRDPMETAANALGIQAQRQANELNALKRQAFEEERAAAQADEAVMRQFFADGGRNLDLLNSRPALRIREEKRLQEANKERAATRKTEGEALDAAIKRFRGALDFIDTPQGVARWYQAQYQDPVLGQFMADKLGSVEDAIAGVPTDPQRFQQWRQQVAMGMDKFLDNQRQAINDRVVIGPDGRPVPNEVRIAADERVQRAGVPVSIIQTAQGPALAPTNVPRGASRANLIPLVDPTQPVGPDNQPPRVPPPKPDDFSRADKLRDEFQKNAGEFVKVRDAWERVQSAASTPSAAGDLALIFNYMKMLDPGSVVREGEFATAQNAAGIPDRIRNIYNNAVNGQRLNPEQRADFLRQARGQYQAAERGLVQLEDQYRGLASQWGVPPEKVITDYRVRAKPSGQSRAAPSSDDDALIRKWLR